MSKEISKENILSYLKEWNSFESMNISEEGEAFKVTLGGESKRLVITTPYEAGEFFLDFELNGKPFFSEWYEIMEDPLSEFMQYTKKVAENYLFNEVRIKTTGWWVFKVNDFSVTKMEFGIMFSKLEHNKKSNQTASPLVL